MAKVNPGDAFRPSAGAWNRHEDVADWYANQKTLGNPQSKQLVAPSYVTVKVRNDSGANVRRGEVLEFTGFLLSELSPEYLWFSGDKHSESAGHVGWGLALQPVPDGSIGEFLVAGVYTAYITINDEGHKFAKLVDGSAVMESAVSGPVRILYKPTGTGELECAVLLSTESEESSFGILVDALNTGGTATVKLFSYDTSWEQGEEVEAIDFYLNDDESVEAGTKVEVVKRAGLWFVRYAYCAVSDNLEVTPEV